MLIYQVTLVPTHSMTMQHEHRYTNLRPYPKCSLQEPFDFRLLNISYLGMRKLIFTGTLSLSLSFHNLLRILLFYPRVIGVKDTVEQTLGCCSRHSVCLARVLYLGQHCSVIAMLAD